ncbi:MAG: hypothetical protein KF830_17395 [Planctomycetes bacterium]|nr:hypothetical protein [Planctomycetota bacterium]
MHPRTPLVLSLLAAAVSLPAQCGESLYGTPLTGGVYSDDVVLSMQSLGFPFPFGGVTYTDVHVSTNGFLYLSNSGAPAPGGSGCCSGSTSLLVAGSPIIAPMWDDLVSDPVYGGEVFFNALPGRGVVTWRNIREYGDATPRTFQVQLLATGEIYFTYDDRCNLYTAGNCLVGMSPGGGAALPAASDFATAGFAATDTNYELFAAVGSFDLAGQAVQFIPTAPGYAWLPQACPNGSHQAFGRGCYSQGNSFYQLITSPPAAAAALSNTAITLLPAGSEYVVINGGAYVPPTGAATPLSLIDDSQTTTPTLTTPFPYPGGTLNSFVVCSNGSVWAATGNSIGYAPDVNVMLNANAQTGWYAWHDYNPGAPGSGQVKFEEIAGVVYITWDGVYNYSGTSPADATQLQFQFDTATGQVVIAFGTVSPNLHTGFQTGQPHLVGYSPGGPSLDTGSLSFASDLPITTSAIEFAAMQLAGGVAPALGATTTYNLSGMPEYIPGSSVHLGTLFLSVLPLPGGFDLGVIGAPGCKTYLLALDVDLGGQVSLTPSMSWNVSLPAGTFAVGNTFAAQAVALVVPNSLPNGQNAFGLTVSNGLLTTVGGW